MEVIYEQFRPDASLSREEMEGLQREIAREATAAISESSPPGEVICRPASDGSSPPRARRT